MPIPNGVPGPWNQFLRDLDAQLDEEVSLYCVGGFAMTLQYGLARQTSDIDVLEIAPLHQLGIVMAIAGQGSQLNKRHGLYIEHVAIMVLPENYHDRTVELFPRQYEKLRLFGLDPYDLALSKLERNSQIDRDDVKYLFRTIPLDPDVLERRYRSEQRPYLSNEGRHDLTLSLWRDMLIEP